MNYKPDNLQSALNVEAIVDALDIPEPYKAPFRVPRILVDGEWQYGTISTEAFMEGELRVSDA